MADSAAGSSAGTTTQGAHTATAGVGEDPAASRTLVGLYLLLYAAFGTFFPYFNLYLKEQGWSGAAVGTISALGPLVILMSQPFWGMVNDRWGASGRLVALNGLLVGVLGLGYRYTASFAWLLFLTGLVALLRGRSSGSTP